jgi:hypothetical protein
MANPLYFESARLKVNRFKTIHHGDTARSKSKNRFLVFRFRGKDGGKINSWRNGYGSVPVLAHKRITFPVFGGISGWNRTTAVKRNSRNSENRFEKYRKRIKSV